MVDELKQNPKIKITKQNPNGYQTKTPFIINPPATDKEIQLAEKYLKRKIPKDILDFYKEANGLQLSWELRERYQDKFDSDTIEGHILILPIQEVFKDWKDIIYFDFEGGETFKLLHPIDFFVAEACAALYLDDSDNPGVYYHYCGEEMYSLNMTFKEYLNALLKTRGFWYWQTAVVAELTGEEDIEEPEDFRNTMPLLFPDFKLSEILK